jgi:hypothetical protein
MTRLTWAVVRDSLMGYHMDTSRPDAIGKWAPNFGEPEALHAYEFDGYHNGQLHVP